MAESEEEKQEAGYGGLRSPQKPEPIDEVPLFPPDTGDRPLSTSSLEQLVEEITSGPLRNTLQEQLAERLRKRLPRLAPRIRMILYQAADLQQNLLEKGGTAVPVERIRLNLYHATQALMLHRQASGSPISFVDALELVQEDGDWLQRL